MKKMQKKILEHNQKLQSELNMARRLQCSLLPKELPRTRLISHMFTGPVKPSEGTFGYIQDR